MYKHLNFPMTFWFRTRFTVSQGAFTALWMLSANTLAGSYITFYILCVLDYFIQMTNLKKVSHRVKTIVILKEIPGKIPTAWNSITIHLNKQCNPYSLHKPELK